MGNCNAAATTRPRVLCLLKRGVNGSARNGRRSLLDTRLCNSLCVQPGYTLFLLGPHTLSDGKIKGLHVLEILLCSRSRKPDVRPAEGRICEPGLSEEPR